MTQIGNLGIPKLDDTWDKISPSKYTAWTHNIYGNYGEKFFEKDLSEYSEEDRELWNNNPNPESIPRLYLTIKYDDSKWLGKLEIELGTLYGKCKDVEVVKEFIVENIDKIEEETLEISKYLTEKCFIGGSRNTSINYSRQEEKYYSLHDKKKELEEWL